MSNLKVFQMASDGKIEEVELGRVKGISEHKIHPHTVSSRIDPKLSDIMKAVVDKNVDDAVMVTVGIGDPTSVPSGDVIPQEQYIARGSQLAITNHRALV